MPWSGEVGRLEEQVYQQRWDGAAGRLFTVLQELEENGSSDESAGGEVELRAQFTRLAAAVTALFASPDYELSQADFSRLSYSTATLAHAFYLSGFRTADALLDLITGRGGAGADGGVAFRDKSDARKFLLACSIYSRHFPRLAELLRRDPQTLYAVFLRAFTVHVTAEPRAETHRELLLAAVPQLVEVVPRTPGLPTLHQVWGLCSYVPASDRHAAKRHLNRMIGNWLDGQGIRPPPLRPRPAGERPTVLVACEVLGGSHVMYRCFAPFLRQLRRRFRVVALVSTEYRGEGGSDWCDEVEDFSQADLPIAELVERVSRIGPDVIYYPCVGVQAWGAVLCNLRLAPLQFATLGHPATTQSPHIDAVVVGHDLVGDPERYSETVVVLRGPGHLYELRPGDGTRPPPDPDRRGVVRLAAVANLLKLNSRFLRVCRRIAENSPRPLEFHIFPNCVGLRWHVTRQQMAELLPGAVVNVHPRLPFPSYRERLGRCDIYLGTFPFGGENSTLDALLLGLPAVALEGDEVMSRLDARVVRLAGLPEWLITRTEDEYERAALRLIDDDARRGELARSLNPQAIRARVDDENRTYATDFIDTVWWMYCNQERLRTSGRKAWRPEDREGEPS